MAIAITNPSIVINNIPIAVVGNSVTTNDGLGEYNYRAQSAGGGSIQGVLGVNVETMIPMIKFSMLPTPENIGMANNWKTNFDQNAITLSGALPNGTKFTRSYNKAALISNIDFNLGFDGTFECEFRAESVI